MLTWQVLRRARPAGVAGLAAAVALGGPRLRPVVRPPVLPPVLPLMRPMVVPLAMSVVLPWVVTLAGCGSTGGEAGGRSPAEIEAMKRVRFEDTPEGARAVLDESILFEFGKAEFSGSADPVLDVLKPAFAKARGQIVVEGHTDSVGTEAVNLSLSRRRADKVREAVIKRQVPPERVLARGLGASKPRRSPEATDEDRRLNRRAEFLFRGETVASLGGEEMERAAESRLAQLGKALSRTAERVGDWIQRQTGGGGDKAGEKK